MRFVLTVVSVLSFVAAGAPAICPAQDAQLKQALGIKPKHADEADYDIPAEKDLAVCTIESSKKSLDQPGWIVRDAAGRSLRIFLDTNGDNKLDQWSFFRNGLEVYRDIDTNKNSKPDQHRWIGAAGMRWGVDSDEDGKLDSWKMISGEEVAVEVFEAVRTADEARFSRLLPTPAELAGLELGERMEPAVASAVRNASEGFKGFASQQKKINAQTRFVHFGASRPSLAVAGSQGLKQDLIVHDQATAVFESGKELEQLSLGTLVRIGDAWRVLELPVLAGDGETQTNGGLFFPLPGVGDSSAMGAVGPETARLNELFEKWQKLDEKLQDPKAGAETDALQAERIDVLVDLALAAATAEDRKNWIRQLTDTATQAYQKGVFSTALDKLGEVSARLVKEKMEEETDYIQWSTAATRYAASFAGDAEKRSEATEKFMADLEAFVTQFPKSDFAAEAMMQLALYTEVNVSGGAEKSLVWYERVAREFPETPFGKKAAGAVVRLTAVGKPLAFRGKSLAGQDFDLADRRLRGKIVVLFYWATWATTTSDDFDDLQRLMAKFKDELVVVGACLDEKKDEAETFLKSKPNAAWTNLFEEGGVDASPLAIQLGVSGPPLVVLVDEEGKTVDTTLSVKDLDREIQRLIRRREAADK